MEWDKIVALHPEIATQIDPAPDLKNSAETILYNGREYIRITQSGEFEGGQSTFEIKDGKAVRAFSDTVTPLQDLGKEISIAPESAMVCGESSEDDHAKMFETAKASVDVFSSAAGPDGGNLACVWAVRHIAFNALGRWVTRTDGTAVFGPELKQCFGAAWPHNEVLAGGIVISPTRGSTIGHVGVLGDGTGDGARKIFSNSSKAAKWKQNFTVDSWIQRYSKTKGLDVLFFPLPHSKPAATS